MDELRSNSPLLLKVLTSIAVRNDHRNRKKVGSAHYPGITTAAAVLLKERNCHVSGDQSLVSMLMYSSHCEKQVKQCYITLEKQYKLCLLHTAVQSTKSVEHVPQLLQYHPSH